jgi:acyl-CoA-binding protein
MRFPLPFVVVFSVLIAACRRETATQAEPVATSTDKPANAAASALIAQPFPSTNPAPPVASSVTSAPSASGSSAVHAPAPIAAADLERATQYVNGLARGRKATAAKDFAAAVGFFDLALVAEPGDARALSERGYAQLLRGDFDAAAKDLESAAKRAASAELLRQILFNQATVAEKRGDTAAAKAFRDQRDDLNSAKRSKSKDCEVSITRPGTLPIVAKTYRDAWIAIKKAHFDHWGTAVDTLESPVIDDKATEETIRKALVGNGPPGDGAYAIMTESPTFQVGHVLFVRGNKIHLLVGLGGFMMGRCPFGDSLPTVVDGDEPRIQVDTENLEMGYMCGVPNSNEIQPCVDLPNATPVQSYCYWTGSKFRTLILDPKTLAVMVQVEESIEPHGNMTFQAAQSRTVITRQPTAVLVTGCGIEQRETIP